MENDYDMNALNRYIMGKERQCKAYPNYISFQNQAQTQEKIYFDKKCVGTIYWQALDCLYVYINLFLYFVSISKCKFISKGRVKMILTRSALERYTGKHLIVQFNLFLYLFQKANAKQF